MNAGGDSSSSSSGTGRRRGHHFADSLHQRICIVESSRSWRANVSFSRAHDRVPSTADASFERRCIDASADSTFVDLRGERERVETEASGMRRCAARGTYRRQESDATNVQRGWRGEERQTRADETAKRERMGKGEKSLFVPARGPGIALASHCASSRRNSKSAPQALSASCRVCSTNSSVACLASPKLTV